MNVFADRLFALLLGWTGMLFNGLWNLINNASSGVTGFLSRFWAPLLIMLLIFGTLTDYIVWLIRWRPYVVWQSWFSKRVRHKRLDMTRRYMEELDQAPLDLPEYREEQSDIGRVMRQNEPVYFQYRPPQDPQLNDSAGGNSGEAVLEPDLHEEAPSPYVPPFPWEYPAQETLDEFSNQPPMLPPDSALPYDGPFTPDQPYIEEQPEFDLLTDSLPPREGVSDESPAASQRKRRAGARKQRPPGVLRKIRDSLAASSGEYETLDGLPPPVSQEDAYNKPYYPQNYSYRAPTPMPQTRETDDPPQ